MLLWTLIILTIFIILAYHQAALSIWAISTGLLLVFFTRFSHATFFTASVAWTLSLCIFIFLYSAVLRRRLLTGKIFQLYCRLMPAMSHTEHEALLAGTVAWEGDLFSAKPHWEKLLRTPQPELTAEEKAFLAGPVEQLCAMLDDWDITHHRLDLPTEVWEFIKTQGFWGLIIPKEYGGKAFSVYAHSQVLAKLSGRSYTAAITVSVPNSLGPAELLLHYGTPEQKNYYLPRLARGEEIPCFALTSPEAGSDASAMLDKGVICWGEHEGQRVLGIRINWNKRYITMAPIATVIGLAFKLYDPEHLHSKKTELGITCALIPRHTPGVTLGRRHFPCNIPFQNGPIQGKDVFIPMDWIIGGKEMAGKGWRMLMECLAAGRGISLPGMTTGGAKSACYASGAYARIRRQFHLPIGRFEGIEQVLARIAGYTYIMEAARLFMAAAIDAGEKPAVASAIVKYHCTELGRMIAADTMDLHGGKAICLGPKNYIGRAYQALPIAITVEGANILTRNMIIFGQGIIRCHPYIFQEMEAAHHEDKQAGCIAFDRVFIKHVSFVISNFVRSLVMGLTASHLVRVPQSKVRRYFQHATRFSSALAFLSDVAIITLGGGLKRKENISARLGDILSYLYLLSAVTKHYHDQGEPAEDLPLVAWASETCLYEIQQRFSEIFKNLRPRWLAYLLRAIIFPWGKHFAKPKDKESHQIAQLFLAPTDSRARLTEGTFVSDAGNNPLADLADALIKVIAAEPIEKNLRYSQREGKITGQTITEQAQAGLEKQLISQTEFAIIIAAEAARGKIIAVDDFAPGEL